MGVGRQGDGVRSCPNGKSFVSADPPFRNGIINRLSASDLDLLQPHLKRVDLALRRRLASANVAIDTAYFLESGLASTATGIRHDPPIEVGITGREGLANLPLLLGIDRSPNDIFMQIGGGGLSIGAAALREAMAQSPSLSRWLLRYLHVFMVQTASTALANGCASVSERLARWLLMAHDRIDGDTLPLTHEFLAIMLGVRRAGVTVALREFERRAMIDRSRGSIMVLNRQGLEVAANGYYGAAEAEMRRIFDEPAPG